MSNYQNLVTLLREDVGWFHATQIKQNWTQRDKRSCRAFASTLNKQNKTELALNLPLGQSVVDEISSDEEDAVEIWCYLESRERKRKLLFGVEREEAQDLG